MSELRPALLNFLRSLDANDTSDASGEARASLEAAVADVDLQAARADAKKNPASLDATAAVIARLIVDDAGSKDIVNAAKVAAQRAPRNADGNAVALLAGLAIWKVSNNPKLAEPYFRRVRRGEPANQDLLAFYRSVYSGEKEAAQLMQVLVQARRACKDEPVQRLALAQEMADLAEGKLGSVDRAIEVWRSVLREDGYDEDVATALRRLYRLGEKWTALVELLKDQFNRIPEEPEHNEDRIQRLLEITEIYRDHMHLDTMALQTLQRILDIDPRHDASLKALADTYGKAGRWNDLLAVYAKLGESAKKEGDQERQVDMLRRVASIYLDELNDAEQGLARLNEALEIMPADRKSRAMIARVYELNGDWDALISLLREQLQDAPEEAAREIRIQLARLIQDRYEDVEQHVTAWNEVLEHHGDVEEALAALAGLYEGQARWPEAAEILHRRVKITEDTTRAVRLLSHLGALYTERLQSPDDATRVWEEVIRLDPQNAEAAAVLRDTYVASARWDDLVELYSKQGEFERVITILMETADAGDDVDERLELYQRVAQLSRDRLGSAAAALPALERMLELKPGDPLIAHELLPIYREQQDWTKLVSAYEVLLGAAEDDDERLEYIAAIRDVALHKQERPEVALQWAGRAYQLRPDDEVLRAGLESAAERCNGWSELIELFEARLESDACEHWERLELLDKLAAVARDRVRDAQLAEKYLKRILELESGSENALASLEDLYMDFEMWDELAGVYRVRLEQADSIETQLTLLRRLARLQETQIGDTEAAVRTLDDVLLLAPTDQAALESQSRILKKSGNWKGFVEVLERRLAFMDATDAQIPLLFEVSKVYAERMHESDKAINGFLKVLEFEPDHLPTIDALEHLRRADPSVALRVVRGLLPYYRSVKDRLKEAEAMEVVANHEPDPGVRRLQLTELLDVYQRMGGREVDVLRVRLSLFVTEPLDATGRARLRKEARDLEQLPAVAKAFDRAIEYISERIQKAELAGREIKESDKALRRNLRIELGSLFRDYLDDSDGAERVYAAILDEDESHEEAYESLEELYRSRGAHDKLVSLYRRRADAIFDPGEQRKLLERIVKLARHALDDKTIAIRTAEELLDLEPDDLAIIELLAGMYEESASRDDHFALEELYGRWLDLIDDDELRLDLLTRRAALRKDRLDDPVGAVEVLGAVIVENERHDRARELLEQLLDVDAVKLQVATMLEPIYVQLDDHEAVIRVLLVRRAAAMAAGQIDEAIAYLLQIAQIEEIDLNKPERAFETLREAYIMDPRRTDTRSEVQRLGMELEQQRALVEIWESALERTEDTRLRLDLLSRMAVILDEFLGDVDAARATYAQLVDLDPLDLPLIEKSTKALVRLHRRAEDYPALVEALRGQLRFQEEPKDQVRISIEIAQLLEEQIGDLVGASTAFYEVLDYDPENTMALDALERLFVQLEDWEQLCDVLRQRVEVVDDEFEKTRLWRKIGEVQRDKAENLHAAIEAFQWIIDLGVSEGETRAAIEAMIELNYRLERWADVEEELRRLSAMVESDGERAALLERTAEVVGDKLLRHPDAVELLQEVLLIDPARESARERLKKMFGHEVVRDRIVEILKPLYEAEQDWTALVDLEERQARTLSRGPDRVDALMRIAETYETRLDDSERAFNILCGLMMDAGEMAQLPEIIARVERLGQVPERASAVLAAYQETVDNVLDAEVMLQLLRNIGAVSLTRLNKLDEARSAYERVIELEPGDARALDALELIYVSENDQGALAELLVRRADQVFDEQRREELWIRAAEIFAAELERPEYAIDLYERLSPESQVRPRVQSNLEALYEKTERHLDLATFLERRLETLDGSELVDARIRLARLFAGKLANAEEGLRHFAEALRLDPARALATGELERYLDEADIRAQVIETLEPVFVDIGDWGRVIKMQELRLEDAEAPEEQAAILTKIAEIEEVSLADAEKAFTTYARVFRLQPGDAHCRAELDRLARALEKVTEYARLLTDYLNDDVPGDDRDEILEVVSEAAALWVDLAQYAVAVPLYQRLLTARPDDTAVFPRLEGALRQAEMWPQLADAYWQEADVSLDEAHQVEVLLKLSQLALNIIVDDEMAVRAFRRVLETRPEHDDARAQLEGLLERTEQWEALVDALRERQNRSEDLETRAAVMLRIAALQDQRLDDASAAVDTLEVALMETEGGAEAVGELEALATTREEQRERIYALLRPIYEDRGNVDRLVAIGEWKLTVTDEAEARHQIYREMADLLEPTQDGALQAFRVLLRALAEPGPHDATSGLDAEVARLARQLGAFESLAQAMIDAASADSLLEERERRVNLLVQAATFQLDAGDNDSAVVILRQGLAVIEDHPEALRLLDEALIRTSRYEELVSVLERRVRIAEADIDRLDLTRRLARLHEDTLANDTQAIAAWRQLLDIEAQDGEALSRLRSAYENNGSTRELIEVLDRQIEAALDPDERRNLRRDLARIHRNAGDRPAEIEALRELLLEEPGDDTAMEALATALLEEERFSDAAEVMLDRANAAEADGRRAELLLEVARVYAGSLGDTTTALGHYEGVLMADSGQLGALRDLVTMAGRPEDHEAVAALVLPHLDQRGRYKDLATVLEARSRLAEDSFEATEALKQLARVRWERLHDPEGSLEAYNNLMDRVSPEELGPVLSQAARLSVHLGRAEAHVDALARRSTNESLDPQARVLIALSAADISEEIMGDKTKALAMLAPLVEAGLADGELCKSVERLARSLGNKQLMALALRELSRLSEGGQEQAEILVRLGDAELGAGNRDDAMSAYREALDVIPGFAGAVAGLERILEINEREGTAAGDEVLDSLERAYQDAGNKPGLARLTRMRLESAEGRELLRLLEQLGGLIDEGGGKPRESLEVWGNLIMRDAENEAALRRVAELAQHRPLLSDAIHFMAAAIDAAQEQRRPCFGLCIATTKILLEQIGDPMTALRALRPALSEKPDSPEALKLQIISARACNEFAILHGALTHYAGLLDNLEEAAHLWREAADVASRLGNVADVRRDLEQLIDIDETDEAAWHKWLEVLAQSEAWEDLAEGLGRRAMITENEEERHILRHHLARLLVDRLGRVDDAVNTYHDMLAARPEDLDVMGELETLLRRHERWIDVRDVLERKAEHVQGELRVGVLEELARVVAISLAEPSDAIEIYHRILAESPGHKGSLEALEKLLADAERWPDLAQLKDNRIEQLRGEAETSEAAAQELLQCTLSLAVLLADRMSEEVRARALLDEVLEKDPDNIAALLCLSKVQEVTGDNEAMLATLQRAMALNPVGEPGSELRVRMSKLTESAEERREHLEQALHMNPQNLEAANLLLVLSREEGYWEQVAYLLALVATFEQDKDARRQLELERIDILIERLGQYDEALQGLAPIYEQVQDNVDINRRIADALFASERYEEAQGMYNWLAELGTSGRRDKRQAKYLTRLARIELHLGVQGDGPLDRLKEAYRIDTTNAETLVTLADLYAARGDWKESLKLARTMLLQNVDRSGIIRRGDIYIRLANAHLELDEHTKAVSMLRRGRQEDPEHAEVAALLEQVQGQG